MTKCKQPLCDKDSKIKGFCCSHYKADYARRKRQTETRLCTTDGCLRKIYERKLCSACYAKTIRLENPRSVEQKRAASAKSKEYYYKNKDACKLKNKASYHSNVEYRRKKNRERWKINRDKNLEISKQYYVKHRDTIYPRLREYARNYRKANLPRYSYLASKRRAAKLQRTPGWLSEDQLLKISQIYANCAAGSNVDHIIPLQGKNVSGLHVPWNLRTISATDNFKKLNKFDPALYRAEDFKDFFGYV